MLACVCIGSSFFFGGPSPVMGDGPLPDYMLANPAHYLHTRVVTTPRTYQDFLPPVHDNWRSGDDWWERFFFGMELKGFRISQGFRVRVFGCFAVAQSSSLYSAILCCKVLEPEIVIVIEAVPGRPDHRCPRIRNRKPLRCPGVQGRARHDKAC